MILEIGVAATSLLFFMRVRAVYDHSRIITAFFGLLWLVVVSLHILILLGVKRGTYFCGLPYNDVGMGMNRQIVYHTRDAVSKALHRNTLRSQSF
jgi:hypothetical protein